MLVDVFSRVIQLYLRIFLLYAEHNGKRSTFPWCVTGETLFLLEDAGAFKKKA